jgi:hypothetical protein
MRDLRLVRHPPPLMTEHGGAAPNWSENITGDRNSVIPYGPTPTTRCYNNGGSEEADLTDGEDGGVLTLDDVGPRGGATVFVEKLAFLCGLPHLATVLQCFHGPQRHPSTAVSRSLTDRNGDGDRGWILSLFSPSFPGDEHSQVLSAFGWLGRCGDRFYMLA